MCRICYSSKIEMGHSQGAKMAAQFVYKHPGVIDKLVLIGTTHPRGISLAGRQLPVLKIENLRFPRWGGRRGLVGVILATAPAASRFIPQDARDAECCKPGAQINV